MKSTWSGIVKVQRELAPNPDAKVFITSQNLEIVYIGPMEPEVLAWLGTAVKKYCIASRHDDGIIDLKTKGTQLGDLGW